ncbi:unnamed protein product, partial [Ilex paraguariensis]
MGSRKPDKRSKTRTPHPLRSRNPNKKSKRLPLGPNRAKTKKSKNTKHKTSKLEIKNTKIKRNESKNVVIESPTALQQMNFFLSQYQSANGVQLSSLELESIK